VGKAVTPLEVLRRYPAHDYTLHGVLVSRAQTIPENSFIEFGDTRLSYSQTLARAHETMALLAAKGVKPGDRVAVMSHNHPATVIVFVALASLGAVMVGVNPDFGEKEARYVLDHSQSNGVICSLAALPTVQVVVDTLRARPWIVTNTVNSAGLPPLLDAPSGMQRATPAPIGRANDACLIIYTSGTTGQPKGVMHSQRSVVLAGEGFVRRMHLHPEERLLCILPMFHANAICYSLLGTIAAGATLLLEEKFSPSNFWKSVAARQATEANTIAAHYCCRRRSVRRHPGHGAIRDRVERSQSARCCGHRARSSGLCRPCERRIGHDCKGAGRPSPGLASQPSGYLYPICKEGIHVGRARCTPWAQVLEHGMVFVSENRPCTTEGPPLTQPWPSNALTPCPHTPPTNFGNRCPRPAVFCPSGARRP
jgi:hypothetical protein